MAAFKNWIQASRPKTLTAAVVPVVVATAFVHFKNHDLIWWTSVCALLSSIFIQIGTNFVNDAQDFKKGADTHERLGPRRVTQSGDFSYSTVMKAAALMFLGSLALGIPLVTHGGLPILLIGVVSVFCGYAYTSGPFPLAYRGLGDVFVVVFFGVVPVMGTFYLHTSTWDLEAGLVGFQVGLLSAVLIAINNLRDIYTDAKVGKRTLAVRLGEAGAKLEIQALMLLPFVLNFYWIVRNPSWFLITLIPFLSLPFVFILRQKIRKTAPSTEYNSFLGKAAALHLLFGVLLSFGFLVIQ